MRLSLGLLVCLGMGALCAACADDPTKASSAAAAPPPVLAASPAAAPATPVAAAASAAPSAPADKLADADQDRHFRSLGYSLKMHDGEKLWCRHEEVLGSRVGGKLVCSTPEQIRVTEQQSKDITESVQRSSRTGCTKPCS
jgi:hypothetical protein